MLWTAIIGVRENLNAANNKYVQFTMSPQFLPVCLKNGWKPYYEGEVQHHQWRATEALSAEPCKQGIQPFRMYCCIMQSMCRNTSSSVVLSQHSRNDLYQTQQWLIICTTNCISMSNAFFTIIGWVNEA